MSLFTPLGPPPNSGDPGTFNNRADALLGQLPTLVDELNTMGPLLMSKYRAACTGTADAIILTAGFITLPVGTQVRFRATANNTGPATIKLDGSGAIACRTITGATLPAGYIRTSVDTVATYDGTYWVLDRVPNTGTTPMASISGMPTASSSVSRRSPASRSPSSWQAASTEARRRSHGHSPPPSFSRGHPFPDASRRTSTAFA